MSNIDILGIIIVKCSRTSTSRSPVKEVRDDGSMPFLDILVTPKEDGSLSTSAFRKPTHTGLYLQWDSHHTIYLQIILWLETRTIELKQYALIHSCKRKKKTICAKPSRNAGTPSWAINRAKIKSQNPSRAKVKNNNNQTGQKTTNNTKHTYGGTIPTRAK